MLDDIRDLVNNGKLQTSVATTGVPGWFAGTGEQAFFSSGSDRRLYLRTNTAWLLVAGFNPTLLPSALGTVSAGTGNNFALVDHIHAGVRKKVGSFTRDLTLASGTQAITGVGFTSRAVVFFAVVPTVTGQTSWGFSDGTTHAVIEDQYVSVAGRNASIANLCISLLGPTASDRADASVSTMDTDGFTLSWTKTGSPTGTATILYLAVE